MKKRACFGKRPEILFVLAMLIFVAVISAGFVAAEEIQTGDSIAPMKMEIDMEEEANPDSETIIKTIYVRNTGNTPTHYIFYTEQNGGKNEISSKFQLSETETEINPGNTFELILTVSKKELEKYDSKDLENVKIKMIRNPKSQTPVGYIIPVKITRLNEKESGEAADNKKNSNGTAGGTNRISEKISDALNDVKDGGNTTKNGRNETSEKDGKTETIEKKKDMPNGTANRIIVVGLLSAFAVFIGGLYLNRKRKKK